MICPRCQASIPDGSRFCSQCGTPLATIMRRVTLARLLDARGRTEEAEAVLSEIDAATFPHGAVWLSTMLASHHLTAGDLEAARRSLEAAIEAQDTMHCLACKALLGRALARRAAAGGAQPGDRDRSPALLGEALEVFERLGARPSIDEAVAEPARLDARPDPRLQGTGNRL